MQTVRLRYPFDVVDGRLGVVQNDAEAVRRLLGMLRDLAPGDFAGMPKFYNPCDLIDVGDRAELLPQVRQALQKFFVELPLPDVIVETEVAPAGIALLGYVVISGEHDWRLRVPIRQGDCRVVLDLGSYEEG